MANVEGMLKELPDVKSIEVVRNGKSFRYRFYVGNIVVGLLDEIMRIAVRHGLEEKQVQVVIRKW